MREILFKGKRKDNGEWTQGYYCKSYGRFNGHIYDYYSIYDYERGEHYEVIPETVRQYTGLTDKNGKKIFEGDIVKIKTGLMLNGKHAYCRIGKVVYTQCCYFVFLGADNNRRMRLYRENDDETCEIIGNIHDNPELLKGDEE